MMMITINFLLCVCPCYERLFSCSVLMFPTRLGKGTLANWTVIHFAERLSVLQLTDKMPTTVVGKRF